MIIEKRHWAMSSQLYRSEGTFALILITMRAL